VEFETKVPGKNGFEEMEARKDSVLHHVPT
jgi:hypothetical protein